MKLKKPSQPAVAEPVPDAITEGAGSLFDFLREKHTLVLSVVGAVLAMLAVGALVQSSQGAARRASGAKLAAAAALVARPVVESNAPSEDAFASQDAKQKAVAEALAKVEGDPAATGGLVTARLALDAGRFDDAVKGYEAYVQAGGPLAVFAAEGLGYAYEGKGSNDQAKAAFERLAGLGAPGRAAFHKARLLEKAGQKDEARKAYEAVVSGFEKESVAADARARLDLLDLPAPGVGAIEAAPAPAEPAKAEGGAAEEPKKRKKRRSRKSGDD